MKANKNSRALKSVGAVARACSVTVLLGGMASGVQGVEGVISQQLPQGGDDLLESLLNVGPFTIRPHVIGGVVYDDNIRISRDDPQEDLILTAAPGVTVGAGDYRSGGGSFLTFDYTPSFYLYTRNDENSTIDHLMNLSAKYTATKLSVGLGQSYQATSGGLVEAGDRVDRDIYVTTLTTRYLWSQKTSFEANLMQTIADYSELEVPGYNEWVNQDWVNYALSDKVGVGLGATFAIRDVKKSPNETYEQGLVRVGYQLSTKVDVSVSTGAEFRQFQDDGTEGPSFVFSFGGVWQPRYGTEVSLEAFRQDRTSVVAYGQNYIALGVRGTVRQRMGRRMSVAVGGGYQNAEYRGVADGPDTSRQDNYYYVGPELNYRITGRWEAGIFYQYRQNLSNEDPFEFENNQVGLRTTFKF